MKKSILLFLILPVFYGLKAQAPDLTGTWGIFEITYTTPQGNQVMTEEQMKADNSFSDYYLMQDGALKMVSNQTGSGTTDTYEGTWKFTDGKFTTSIKMGERVIDIVWDAELKDNILNLKRTSPDGSITIVNRFRKKI
jgi:hypothetical protein